MVRSVRLPFRSIEPSTICRSVHRALYRGCLRDYHQALRHQCYSPFNCHHNLGLVNHRQLQCSSRPMFLAHTSLKQHLILDILRATEAFVQLKDGGALGYYLNLSNPLQAAKTAIYVLLTLVGDGFVVRCLTLVWNPGSYCRGTRFFAVSRCGIARGGSLYFHSRCSAGPEVSILLCGGRPFLTLLSQSLASARRTHFHMLLQAPKSFSLLLYLG